MLLDENLFLLCLLRFSAILRKRFLSRFYDVTDMRRAAYIALLASLMIVGIISVCYGQQLQLWLEDEYGARTTTFSRGSGIVLAITAPNPSNVKCDLWYPPGTTGPPSRTFIGTRTIPGGNRITRIGPNYLEEKAPSGDYLLKCYVKDTVTGVVTPHDLRFTYAPEEKVPPPPPPPPPAWEIIAAAAVGTAAVILVIYAIYSRRPRAPPKPAAPPTPPPTYPPPTPPKREAYPAKPPARERPRKRPKVVGERSE